MIHVRLFLVAAGMCGLLACTGVSKPVEPTIEPCVLTSVPAETRRLSAGGRLRVELAFQPPVTGWTVTGSGLLEAQHLEGEVLQLKAPVGSSGAQEVQLAVSCGDRTGLAEFTVEVNQPQWKPLSQWSESSAGAIGGPPNREYGVMWQDSGDPNRLLLYGGFHYYPQQFTPSSDLWEFDVASARWSELTTTTEGPRFMGGRVAPVPGAREVLFLGGVNERFEAPFHLDRLAYAPDALAWSTQTADGPSEFSDYQPGFVFDRKRGRYISFCGHAPDFHCRVRSLTVDGAATGAWSDVSVSGPSPVGRTGMYFVLDEETDRIVLFGGMTTGEAILGDTWALELGESPPRWLQLGDHNPALKRRNGAFALDSANHRFIVWGGTPDGANVATPALISLDLDRGREMWVPLTASNPPPPRASSVGVYDAAHARFIGGFGNSREGRFNDLWSLDF